MRRRRSPALMRATSSAGITSRSPARAAASTARMPGASRNACRASAAKYALPVFTVTAWCAPASSPHSPSPLSPSTKWRSRSSSASSSPSATYLATHFASSGATKRASASVSSTASASVATSSLHSGGASVTPSGSCCCQLMPMRRPMKRNTSLLSGTPSSCGDSAGTRRRTTAVPPSTWSSSPTSTRCVVVELLRFSGGRLASLSPSPNRAAAAAAPPASSAGICTTAVNPAVSRNAAPAACVTQLRKRPPASMPSSAMPASERNEMTSRPRWLRMRMPGTAFTAVTDDASSVRRSTVSCGAKWYVRNGRKARSCDGVSAPMPRRDSSASVPTTGSARPRKMARSHQLSSSKASGSESSAMRAMPMA
mmetsp:Transcript_11459/g.39941  ORF Transcript_11459/g.39941 Transcript_11459/m.39941 type:complete len:368 (-) Transcript_11459:1138-2241(-)